MGPISRVFGALEQAQEPIAEARVALGLEGMRVEAARNFRDKARMKDVLRANGLPCARHCLAAHPKEAVEFVARVGFPVVVKPPAGAGADATYTIRDQGNLGQFLDANPPSTGRKLLFEEFIAGTEFTFDSISVGGRHLWHSISRYIPTPLEALENPWIQLCMILPRETDENRFEAIRAAGPRALAALGMETGLTHLEWFERGDGSIAISEVAARPPGEQLAQIIGFAHDIDLFAEWARVMVYGRFEPPQRRYAAGLAFLRGQGQGRVVAVHGFEAVARDLGSMIVDYSLPHMGRRHSSHYGGVGYVLVRHPQTEVVKKALGRIITGIRIRVGH
jgi:biotin carboxylase